MIYNFDNFVKNIDENITSAEFMNRFGLSEEEAPVAADEPVEEPADDKKEDADLEAFKKEHLDVMFNELSSDDFDSFYSSEFKTWKEMEDGEEKDKKKEEILTKIKDMFKLGEEAPAEEPAKEDESTDKEEEPAAEEEKG